MSPRAVQSTADEAISAESVLRGRFWTARILQWTVDRAHIAGEELIGITNIEAMKEAISAVHSEGNSS